MGLSSATTPSAASSPRPTSFNHTLINLTLVCKYKCRTQPSFAVFVVRDDDAAVVKQFRSHAPIG